MPNAADCVLRPKYQKLRACRPLAQAVPSVQPYEQRGERRHTYRQSSKVPRVVRCALPPHIRGLEFASLPRCMACQPEHDLVPAVYKKGALIPYSVPVSHTRLRFLRAEQPQKMSEMTFRAGPQSPRVPAATRHLSLQLAPDTQEWLP